MDHFLEGSAIGFLLGLLVAVPAINRSNKRNKQYVDGARERGEIFQQGFEIGAAHGINGKIVNMAGKK